LACRIYHIYIKFGRLELAVAEVSNLLL